MLAKKMQNFISNFHFEPRKQIYNEQEQPSQNSSIKLSKKILNFAQAASQGLLRGLGLQKEEPVTE